MVAHGPTGTGEFIGPVDNKRDRIWDLVDGQVAGGRKGEHLVTGVAPVCTTGARQSGVTGTCPRVRWGGGRR